MSATPFPVDVDGVRVDAGDRPARGFGVLDTLLAEDGLRWFEELHLARLRAACARFAIPAFERFDVAGLLARHGAGLGARTALVRTLALRDPRTGAASVVVDARAPRVVPEHGVELLPVEARADPLGGWKTTNRLARDLAAERAERAGCFDALLVLPGGAVAEVARGNLYAASGGRIATPPLAAGCLPGIVRGLLVRHAGVVERALELDDLRRADEVWISSSGVRIAAVRAIRGLRDDLPGAAGPAHLAARATLARLESAYRDRTARR